MNNVIVRQAFAIQTLTADTPSINGAADVESAIALPCDGISVVQLSLGTLGVSTTSITADVLLVDSDGATVSTNIEGMSSVEVDPVEGAFVKLKVDEPIPEGKRVLVRLTPNDGDAVVQCNVVSEVGNNGQYSPRF